MKYIVYQTTNLVNNKIYIGVHQVKDPNTFDGYIGCGVYINRPSTYMNPTTAFQCAVKKYGTNKFKRITLKVFDKEEDVYKLEAELVNEEFIKRTDVYNMTTGGKMCDRIFPVYQFNSDGTLLKKWKNAAEAADFYSVSTTAIFNSIKFNGSCLKFFWSRTESIDPSTYTLYTGGTQCYAYNADGKMIGSYNSMVEAAKANNEFLQAIERAVKGGYIVHDKFYTTIPYEEFKGNPKTQLRGSYLYVYDLEGNYLTKLKGIKNICEYFGIKSNCVIYTAIRCNRPYKNFQLSLEYKDKLDPVTNKRNKSKPVECYDNLGNLVEEFSSVTQAIDKYGTGVKRVLQGTRQQCKGYIFKFKSL